MTAGKVLAARHPYAATKSEAALQWQDDALCAQTDPDMFSPPVGGSTRDAKRICASCTVAEQCLRWALDNDERSGIWGGMSPVQRRNMRKQEAAA